MNDLYQGCGDWDIKRDPTGLWMSEKLDGEFASWDGSRLTTKNGKPIYAPAWWTSSLPKHVHYDGELWMGRGLFQQTISAVRKHTPVDIEWQKVAFMVFDVPINGYDWVTRFKVFTQPPVMPVVHYYIHSLEYMMEFYHKVIENNGEGITIRNPAANYVWKKNSGVVWRLIPERSDVAQVVAMEKGKGHGKYHSKMGSLIVDWKGIQFRLGTGFTDKDRTEPPRCGEWVSFKYSSLTDDGIPKRASYTGKVNV